MEYKFATVAVEDMQTVLNDLSKYGWRLVNAERVQGYYELIFARPAGDDERESQEESKPPMPMKG